MPGRLSPKLQGANAATTSKAARQSDGVVGLDDAPAIFGENPQSADADFHLVTEGRAVAKIVFEASDLYAAIRSPRTATPVELLQCYLNTAVAVHPSSNANVDTADVFLHATSAWVELSDAQSRWRYDMELQAGRGMLKSTPGMDGMPQHVLVPMSIERALIEFGRAAMSCTASPPDDGFGEILLKARALAGNCETHHHHPQDLDVSPTATTVACGLALSAGMLAAGTVASAAGYPGIGACVRKGAIYQGVSQVAMGGMAAYQTPGVRDQFQSRAEWAGSLLGSMPSCFAVRNKANGKGSACQSAVEANKESLKKLPRGTRVRMSGLEGARHLNGRLGEVVGFSGQRYQVRVAQVVCKVGVPASQSASHDPKKDRSDIKLVKRENLELASEPSQPQQVAVSQQEFM